VARRRALVAEVDDLFIPEIGRARVNAYGTASELLGAKHPRV
jgi:hypothetical protein